MTSLIQDPIKYYEERLAICRETYGENALPTKMYRDELRRLKTGQDKKSVAETFNNRPMD